MTKREVRYRSANSGKTVLMATADDYVMVRRPGCIPFVMRLKEWLELPTEQPVADQPNSRSTHP